MAIHNRHDFHAFSALCGSDLCPAAVRHNEGRVNEAFFVIECTSVAKFVGNIGQHSTKNFIAAPSLKAPMYDFVDRRVTTPPRGLMWLLYLNYRLAPEIQRALLSNLLPNDLF
jgi:hypothetical protein